MKTLISPFKKMMCSTGGAIRLIRVACLAVKIRSSCLTSMSFISTLGSLTSTVITMESITTGGVFTLSTPSSLTLMSLGEPLACGVPSQASTSWNSQSYWEQAFSLRGFGIVILVCRTICWTLLPVCKLRLKDWETGASRCGQWPLSFANKICRYAFDLWFDLTSYFR